MTKKYLQCAAVLALLIAPVGAYAAEGDPGTGMSKGSDTPSSQPTAPKQGTATEGRASAKMGGSSGVQTHNPDAGVNVDGSAKMNEKGAK